MEKSTEIHAPTTGVYLMPDEGFKTLHQLKDIQEISRNSNWGPCLITAVYEGDTRPDLSKVGNRVSAT